MVTYHLPWAYVQILLQDAASTIPVGSAKTSLFWKLAAAYMNPSRLQDI